MSRDDGALQRTSPVWQAPAGESLYDMGTSLIARRAVSARDWLARMLSRDALAGDNAPLLALATISFIAHMLVAGNYGYFRDELYYLVDGRHPQLGYVDQPLLMGWLAALMSVVSGDNLVAIHVIPALANAALIVVTGLIARELGAGRLGQALAALAAMLAPVFMATGSIFSMDVLDELCWAIGAYIVVRLLRRDKPRLWLLFGLVAGVALTAKLTMLFFGFALTVALLVTPETRHFFRSRWLWLGGAIAFAFLLPYIIWNVLSGIPTWEFWHHYGGLGTNPLSFLVNQIILLGPLGAALALSGLPFYFRRENRRYRVLGWTVVILFVVLAVGSFKPYFLPPIYPVPLASGALVFERGLQRNLGRAWRRLGSVAVLVLVALLLAPLLMPILPPATFVSRYGFLTGVGNGGAGQATAGAFPQYLGDRFGWDTMTATVARVYNGLPADQKAHACIFTINYGEASALILLGAQDHVQLPPVISGHNNYYLWGPGNCDGSVLIAVGIHPDYSENQILSQSYAQRTTAATITCAYCMAEENDIPVYVYSQPRFVSFARDLWPRLKHFD